MNHNSPYNLQVYCDSDWAGDHKDHKSMTGYVIILNGTAISWKSTKQSGVATSTVEAEYIVLATTTAEVLWMQALLQEARYNNNNNNQSNATVINSDNNGAINIANNGIVGNQIKYINIKHHLIKHNIESNTIALSHCSSKNNMANMFMKALPYPCFVECRVEMGIEEILI